MTRILIFGSGNVGTIYAFILDRAGVDVTCVCRSNYEEARTKGFTINSTIFGHHRCHPAVCYSVDDSCAANKLSSSFFDFVIVCTKATTVAAPGLGVPEIIAPAVDKEHTSIVVIQNGIGVEQAFQNSFPETPLISGVAYLPTTQTSPAVVEHREMEILHLGVFPARSDSLKAERAAERFASLVTAGGGTAVLHEDVQVERWTKLIANTALNPLCALSRCRDLELMEASSSGATVLKGLMLDVASVAAAMGYEKQINEVTVEKQFERSLTRRWPGVEPSMLADVRMGKKLEVETILGEVVRIGREKNVNVDRLETLYVLLKGLDWALQQSSSHSC